MFPIRSNSRSSINDNNETRAKTSLQSFKDAMTNPYKYSNMPLSPNLKMSMNSKFSHNKTLEKVK